MTGNKEVITGSDFKRMVTGAYSEFLLDYEQINALAGAGNLAGTHVLHTMGAAVMPLADCKDGSIGGLARRVSAAAVFGARGNAGVVLAQLFRGLGKGLSGKYNATSSEFGKAFQYGILYAQRIIPENAERPIITVAKAVAKGAYHAVRANMPITEILEKAIEAGQESMEGMEADAGARIMFTFLRGCLRGLDGNFVSPAVSLSLGLESRQPGLPDPRTDLVRPFCVRFAIKNAKINLQELEKSFKDYSSFDAVGWGPLKEVHVTNMSEGHALTMHGALSAVAVLAVAGNKIQARELQENGVQLIVRGSEEEGPSVAELVSAAHSDLAASYVMVAWNRDFWLAYRQAKRLLGNRVELVLLESKVQQAEALKVFNPKHSAAENAKAMLAAAKPA